VNGVSARGRVLKYWVEENELAQVRVGRGYGSQQNSRDFLEAEMHSEDAGEQTGHSAGLK